MIKFQLLADSARIPRCNKRYCKLCRTLEKRRLSQERQQRQSRKVSMLVSVFESVFKRDAK